MIAPNQTVQISINSKNKKYYENILGKQLKIKDVVDISPDNLMHGSTIKFYAICDNCKKEKEVVGQSYFKAVDRNGEYFCEDCHRTRDSKKMRMAWDSKTQDELDEIYAKRKTTCMEKYGVDNPAKNKDVQQRARTTNINRYGGVAPACNQKVLSKIEKTNLKKYGVKYTTQDKETRRKMINSNYSRYGYTNPGQNPEFQVKARKTMYKNGTCPTSKQQYTIYELLMHEYGEDNCKLNYPCLNYNLDCMLQIGDICIDVEYDGWAWHKNAEHDNIRNERVLNEGYKILRIKSGFCPGLVYP